MILRNKICTFTVCAILVLLQSCAKEELDIANHSLFGEPKEICATAVLPQANITNKTSINTTTGKVSWISTDSIIVNMSTLSDISINQNDASLANFRGTASAVESSGNYYYWGIFTHLR